MMESIAAERRSDERISALPMRLQRALARLHTRRGRHLSLLGLVAFVVATAAVVEAEGIFVSRELIFLWILGGLLAVSLADIGGFFRGVIVDWLPFFGALFAYDFLRGLADGALFSPHLLPQIRFDEMLFGGGVPTVWLQQRLFDPASIQWYDFAAWAVYLTHFFAVFVVAAYLWKTQRPRFLRFRNMVLTLTGAAFLTYLLFPAVPPWLASDSGAIGDTSRLVGAVWGDLGVTPAAALWEKGNSFANEVAAVPSLHTAYPVLIMLFLWSGCRRWGRAALVGYALAMSLTLVYTAEHYVADVLLGWLYAGGAYLLVTRLSERWQRRSETIRAP